MGIKDQLKELRRMVRLHSNWLTVKLLGKDAVSSTEYEELRQYGKLPLDENINLVEKSYILGRLRAMLKPSEYRDLSYEEVTAHTSSAELTSAEEFVLEEAKLHAAVHIRGLADDIAAGAFSRLSEAMKTTATESAVKDVIRDQTAFAIQQKLSYQKLASNIAKELQDDWSRDWRRVAETELHRAKVHGQAHAILNRVGIYERMGGPDALISVVPSPDTCEDCDEHFLDLDGNPKIFRLQDLMGQGSNADAGVKHTREGGKHAHWKTTLPPLHPRCGCNLVFVPPGMGWQDGRLQVLDQGVYIEELSKAVDNSSMSPVVKPPGPKSTQGPSTPKPASIPGSAAPGNVAGPGRPSSSSNLSQAKTHIDWNQYTTYRGEGTPPPEANAIQYEKRDGSTGYAVPKNAQASAQIAEERAIQWSRSDEAKSSRVVLDHLSSGKIAKIDTKSDGSTRAMIDNEEARNRGEVGVNEMHLVTIDGNGRGIMKPADPVPDDPEALGRRFANGAGYRIPGTEHKREQAAYGLSTLLAPGLVPPTATRAHEDGRPMSIQHWQEDSRPLGAAMDDLDDGINYHGNDVIKLLKNHPHLRESVETMAVMDYVMANSDAHMNNKLVSSDFQTLNSIDNGLSFGVGFSCRNGVHLNYVSGGAKLRIPESMQTRLENTSFTDMKRAMGDHLEDWEVGQAFLRGKYLLHLQKTEDHLDFEKLGRTEWQSLDGEHHMPRLNGHAWKVGGHDKDALFSMRKAAGQLPSQLFESWAKAYIEEGKNDPSHPNHEDLKALDELGVFMGPGSLMDHREYRSQGKHREYADSIQAKKDLPKKLITPGDLQVGSESVSSSSSEEKKDSSSEKEDSSERGTPPPPGRSAGIAAAEAARRARSRVDSEENDANVSKSLPLYLDQSLLDRSV